MCRSDQEREDQGPDTDHQGVPLESDADWEGSWDGS